MGFPFLLAEQINIPGATTTTNAAATTGNNAAAVVAPANPPASGAAVATGPVASTSASGSAPATIDQPSQNMFESIMRSPIPIFVVVMVFLYFFILRGPRKEEKNRKAAMAALKKGDEVLLISGKYGTIVDIRDDYVVVKVDETNNVKEKYVKNAIQKVIPGDTETKK
jgi:preprotein translocase subunit YajC